MRKILLLLTALFPLFLLGQTQGVVFGVVSDDENRPLELVNVAVPGTTTGTVTDRRGRYSLVLPADTNVRVVYSFIGYEQSEQSFTLKAGERRRCDVNIAAVSTLLPDAVVTDRQTNTSSITRIDAREAVLIPSSGTGGIEDLVKTLPGVSSTNELSSQYNVRGGNFDENLIYVNGIEIYRPFLVGSGQQEGLSFINSRLVSNIEFSAGGFAAEYGDKLSSVLDITYKRPRLTSGSATLSFLGAEGHVEGSANQNKFSYIAGARYKNNKYLLGTMDTKGSYQPNFIDAQTFLSYAFNARWEISALGYYSRNNYKMVPETRETDFGNMQEAYRLKIYFDGQEKSNYSNGMGAFSVSYTPIEGLNMRLTASAYSAAETETYDIQGEYWIGQLSNDNNEQTVTSQGVGAYIEHARNFFYSKVLNVDYKGIYEYRRNVLKWGFHYQHQNFDDETNEWKMIDSAGYTLPHPSDDPFDVQHTDLEMNQVAKAHNKLNVNVFDGYLQHSWKMEADNEDAWVVTAGARVNHWGYAEKTNVSPRAGIAYSPHWNRDMTFRLSGGVYVQNPFYRELRKFDGTLVSPEKADVQKSYQVVLGHEYTFKAWDRPFQLTSEAYYKYLTDIIPYEVDNIRIRYFADQRATGYAAGIDFRINGEFVKGIESWASLSLMKTEEDIKYYIAPDGSILSQGAVDDGAAYVNDTVIKGIPRPSDQRLNFSLFFQDYLPHFPTCKVNVKLVFGTGLPFGPTESERYRHDFRMSSYRRVDVGFSKQLIGNRTQFSEKNPLRFVKNCWISLEVLNLLGINNVSSYLWVTDVRNIQYAVPNYLTNRQLNVKLVAEF